MFNRTKINTGALLALGLIASLPALAQQRVEITGSNIRRAQAETASPVQTVTREEIERSGKTSVAELLQTLAVDNQGSVPTTFGSGFASGASGISLRGLGAASTLVLVNGRRIAPYGLADDGQKVFADLNMIPLEAVERVEVLKDGASSIYGSDAIAGVVNVILRKDFVGTALKASAGQSRYQDGRNLVATVTHGFGNLEKDKFNFLVNFEVTKKDEIYNRDRAGRGVVGRSDLRSIGFDAVNSGGANGGTGAILDNNTAVSSTVGNVRNPTTSNYYSRSQLDGVGFTRTFPGANCSNFSKIPQGDPGFAGGIGCLTDAAQAYGMVQPSLESLNLFARGTMQLTPQVQGYVEANWYKNESFSQTTPSGVNGNAGYPGGPVSNASVSLAASHPDNPYFGSAARVRYQAADVGPRVSNVDSTFVRLVAGAKGNFGSWDFDSAVLHSESKVSNSRTGYLQRDATFALLNPGGANALVAGKTNAEVAAANNPGYAALPAGTFWRIAENAGLNSAALYGALSPTISNDAKSKTTQVDLKVSRDLMSLAGGMMGLAMGAEVRRESISLEPTSGTERGNIIGLGYSAYSGSRTLTAAYAEVLAPVSKQLELSAAVRADHYSDVGNSFTPKLGMKFTPMRELALRATYAEGFRAPSAAENGKGGLAAFSTAADPLRCNLGIQTACSASSVAVITSPNPALKPEKSKSYTLGLVFEPMPGTSASVDFWQIVRKGEINQEATSAAIAAGKVSRDPSTATATPGDPGGITAVLANYVNSSQSTVRGVDLDLRQSFGMGSSGKLDFDLKWTHLFKFERQELDGSVVNFAGTHGNCDVTNCIGTPADRANLGVTWTAGPWRVGAVANYRASISGKDSKESTDCPTLYADGTDAPAGCRLASFTTVDLTVRWKASNNLEVFGSIQNLFDRIPPVDAHTYGATSYNPLDYSGAVGRYYSVGLKYKF
ncbi:MAG TPA: TonB-dependent receptor [Burkholderiaceae bacterium]|nr:TonB-dependent receptor [Burkholderiaceae bacterium]